MAANRHSLTSFGTSPLKDIQASPATGKPLASGLGVPQQPSVAFFLPPGPLLVANGSNSGKAKPGNVWRRYWSGRGPGSRTSRLLLEPKRQLTWLWGVQRQQITMAR